MEEERERIAILEEKKSSTNSSETLLETPTMGVVKSQNSSTEVIESESSLPDSNIEALRVMLEKGEINSPEYAILYPSPPHSSYLQRIN